MLLFFGYRLNWLHSITLDSLLTLVWIVGMTNAFNLLDNMDGLCAGIALIVGAALLIDLLPGAAGARRSPRSRYLALLLGATGGFLVYNVHPASIFMGDSGSLLLGFSFAALTLELRARRRAGRSDVLSIVAAPVLVLLIPIFDTTLVTVSRMALGPIGRRRAAAIIRRTASWRSVCPSGAAVARAVAARRGRRRARRRASTTSTAAGPSLAALVFLVAHGALRRLPGRHPRLRRGRRARRARAR